MALAIRQQLRQSQAIVMTPQLLQSIRLLQLNHRELQAFVDEEIEQNPLVDRAPDPEGWATTHHLPVAEGSEPARDAASAADGFDEPPESLLVDGSDAAPGPNLGLQLSPAANASGLSDRSFLDDLPAAGVSLRGHVAEQIAFSFRGANERLVAAELADQLDEAGYFRGDAGEIAERLGVGRSLVDHVFGACRSFEPAGLFATDLADCLGLQLRARNRLDPAMAAMLNNLELVAQRDFISLRKLCKVDQEDLFDMVAELRALDPRPGSVFSSGVAEPVVPDILVRRAADGGWTVELNPHTLPRVLVDQVYYRAVSARTKEEAGQAFLSECLQKANWLVRSLDQRARTILKVATEVVRQQDGFLHGGVVHLRPLNLQSVADAIGMHESTVSRATSGKFIMTPQGTFELRYFFSAAIAACEGGDAHSSEAVRHRIRRMISAEHSDHVLSDDAIVEQLRHAGIEIARRTVAKYRESMAIPSSVQRRREKRARAAVAC